MDSATRYVIELVDALMRVTPGLLTGACGFLTCLCGVGERVAFMLVACPGRGNVQAGGCVGRACGALLLPFHLRKHLLSISGGQGRIGSGTPPPILPFESYAFVLSSGHLGHALRRLAVEPRVYSYQMFCACEGSAPRFLLASLNM